MGKKDPRVDAYIDNAAPFARPILKHLRRLVHAGCRDAQETIKWGFPHFEHNGVMCGMAAFKNHCAFGFWKAELIFDGDEIARRDAMGQFGRIAGLSDLPDETTLVSYVRKAASLNEAGVKASSVSRAKKKPLKVPAYFSVALKKNAKARKTFENFSPSNQREYVEWVSEAKRDETRQQRLKMSILWLAQGKPRNWKYMPEYRQVTSD
jgi:uncharacterized protein YdeI (YjbR/CyaY-like superfamily)